MENQFGTQLMQALDAVATDRPAAPVQYLGDVLMGKKINVVRFTLSERFLRQNVNSQSNLAVKNIIVNYLI